MNYSYIRGAIKALRPAVIGVIAFFATGQTDYIPQEIATPAAIVLFEFARNYIKTHIVSKKK